MITTAPAVRSYPFIEMRLRNKIPAQEMEAKIRHVLRRSDVNMLAAGPVAVYKPDGKLLLKYLPGAFRTAFMEDFYDTLHELRKQETTNRTYASGTETLERYKDATRQESAPVASAVLGAFEKTRGANICRLTAFTGKNLGRWRGLFPLFQAVGSYFEQEVQDRYAAQMAYVRRTDPEWIIEGTPFSTITVNNSYPTGVHKDAGDLDQGFSTLTVLRRGKYMGGWLTFPEYRVAVDMQDGDLLLMDAHEWHGNTEMTCGDCGQPMGVGALAKNRVDPLDPAGQDIWDHDAHMARGCTAERISVVAYYRTRMTECGSMAEEAQKSADWAELRNRLGEQRAIEFIAQRQAVEEMATETGG